MKKLIQGGGNSMMEAIQNTKNQNTFSIKPTREKCLFVIADKALNEDEENLNGVTDDIDLSKMLFETKSVGTIVFSTDVNSKELVADSPFKNWIMQKYHTYKNRFSAHKMLDKLRRKHNIYCWTIGNYLTGVYTGKNGKTFNENSLSVNIISDSMSFKDIVKLAQEICEVFNQECVLVKDDKNNQVYFVDAI